MINISILPKIAETNEKRGFESKLIQLIKYKTTKYELLENVNYQHRPNVMLLDLIIIHEWKFKKLYILYRLIMFSGCLPRLQVVSKCKYFIYYLLFNKNNCIMNYSSLKY